MKLIANRQLTDVDFGTVNGNEIFDCSDHVAAELIRRGLARKAAHPQILYETKVIVPEAPQVSASETFRHMPVSDAEPAPVATESDRVLSGPDLSAQRTVDPRRWRERKGSRSR